MVTHIENLSRLDEIYKSIQQAYQIHKKYINSLNTARVMITSGWCHCEREKSIINGHTLICFLFLPFAENMEVFHELLVTFSTPPNSVCLLHCVWLLAIPWTVAHQVLLSVRFSWQEYWRELPRSPPGDLPDLGIKPMSPAAPALQADSLLLSHLRSPLPNS